MLPAVKDDPIFPIVEGISPSNLLYAKDLGKKKSINNNLYDELLILSYKRMLPVSKDDPILPIVSGIVPSNRLLFKYLGK